MRKILLLVFLLVSFVSFGQFPSSGRIQFPTSNGTGFRGVGGDSLLWVPSDTLHPASSLTGRRHLAVIGGVSYYWNGTKWAVLAGGGGSTDTTSLSNRINLKLNISDTASMLSTYVNGVGLWLLKTGQTVRADSATIASYLVRRKDSLTSTNVVGYVTKKILADTSAAIRAAIGSTGGGIGAFTDSVANVVYFGAVGDGTTDNTTAFANAAATGRPIFVPKGVFKLSYLYLNRNQMIFGTGNTSVLYTTSARSIIKTSDSCTISGLAFRGTGLSTLPGNTDTLTQNGVWVNGYNNTVTNCTFFKLGGRGVWIHSPTITNMEGNLVTNNVADSNTVAFASSFGSNYGLFANNTARYNVYGYYEYSAANMTNSSNIYQGNTNAMYFGSGDLRGSIVNCQLNHSSVTFTQGNTYGMLISDCSFFNTNLNIGTVDTVKFLNFNNCRFVGCTIAATKADSCQFLGGRFMQTVTVTGSGLKFHDILGTASSVNEYWGSQGFSDSSFNVKNGARINRGLNLPSIPTFTDTTSYKPLVINSSGTVYKATYWPGGGGGSGWGLSGNTLGAYGSYIGTNDSYDLRFITNNTERMRIDSSLGSIGVGVAPQTDFMHTIKSNATTTGVLKLTSDQTSLKWLSFHTDSYGESSYFSPGFLRTNFILGTSNDFQIAEGATSILLIDKTNGQYMSRRFQTKQGASVASANNLTLGNDGNVFEITGTTQINLINKTNWQDGSEITLIFTSTPTVKNGQTTSSSNITIKLSGGADFSATADDVLKLVLSTVGGVQAWREVSRSVN